MYTSGIGSSTNCSRLDTVLARVQTGFHLLSFISTIWKHFHFLSLACYTYSTRLRCGVSAGCILRLVCERHYLASDLFKVTLNFNVRNCHRLKSEVLIHHISQVLKKKSMSIFLCNSSSNHYSHLHVRKNDYRAIKHVTM